MLEQKKLVVSHAPFWHDGSTVTQRCYHTMFAALPAVVFGFFQFGLPAARVVCLSISAAICWELAFNLLTKRAITIGDGNAALIGLLLAMLLPATVPWWLVVTATFIAVIIAKHIFGGIGANAFNPVAIAMAILMVAWKNFLDFEGMLLNYDFNFTAVYPLAAVKHFGTSALTSFTFWDLFMGRQIGGIGATFGLGLVLGGIYLMLRGIIRWEVSLSFLAGVALTAFLFHLVDPSRFASPGYHLLSGYTLVGAFFLATEDSSSPVNFIPMLIYGAAGGIMTVLIRNIGIYVDGVILAILVINLLNPLLDKIRPPALGKVV
jgi:electron transport complex protein RnfD